MLYVSPSHPDLLCSLSLSSPGTSTLGIVGRRHLNCGRKVHTFEYLSPEVKTSQKGLELLSFRQSGEGSEVLLYALLSYFYMFKFLVEEGDIVLP